MKVCTRCGIDKDYSQFVKRSMAKDGYAFACKDCEREYRTTKVDTKREYDAEYRKKNEERLAIRVVSIVEKLNLTQEESDAVVKEMF